VDDAARSEFSKRDWTSVVAALVSVSQPTSASTSSRMFMNVEGRALDRRLTKTLSDVPPRTLD